MQLTIADNQSCVNITKESSTVLIVDDDEECVDVVEIVIQDQQYTVMEGDGEVEVCIEIAGGAISDEPVHITLSTMDDTADGK